MSIFVLLDLMFGEIKGVENLIFGIVDFIRVSSAEVNSLSLYLLAIQSLNFLEVVDLSFV